ncbi:hypothetical protein K450DRAFT_250212 [Umbelopsis ramanniana AG]|uniref:Ion transport domain-containing protein n=1 Tax=Umbelopsis ramanniana AG TaxID=1314678 RepID=A0AAD5E6R9_UMBRA|nr:uncharacterized protein K450DRAFT_250212 [Umbelopsis ramanniana AG]KAI8577824.1 hypothetical protein K450DRAFT_250212 [Umbelopsis ramanniana AG]
MVKNEANRFIYSRFHIFLYLVLALLSLLSLILSLNEVCPSPSLIALEYAINSAMVIEVFIRAVANGRAFFHSYYNAVDIILLLLCIVTLVLITTGCSNAQRDEAIIDTILLTLRNIVQVFRFAAMIQRNKRTMDSRTTKVDFTGLQQQPSTSSLVPSHYGIDSEDDDGVLV